MALEQFLQVGAQDARSGRLSGLLGALETGVTDLAERHREYVLENLRGH
jgi:hypothetical protein